MRRNRHDRAERARAKARRGTERSSSSQHSLSPPWRSLRAWRRHRQGRRRPHVFAFAVRRPGSRFVLLPLALRTPWPLSGRGCCVPHGPLAASRPGYRPVRGNPFLTTVPHPVLHHPYSDSADGIEIMRLNPAPLPFEDANNRLSRLLARKRMPYCALFSEFPHVLMKSEHPHSTKTRSQKIFPSATLHPAVENAKSKRRGSRSFLIKIIQFDDEARGVTSTILADGPNAESVGESVLSNWHKGDGYTRDADDPKVYVYDHNRKSVRLEDVREVAPEHVEILRGYGIEHLDHKKGL